METGLYKQIKLAKKKLEFKLKTVRKKRNFKATTNFFNFFCLKIWAPLQKGERGGGGE